MAQKSTIQQSPLASVHVFVHFFVIVVLAAEMAPAVNESHYIPKARHLWDGDFAARDVFLQSHTSHWLASVFAGLPACLLSFTTVAWIGRFTSWLLMAYAWTRLSKALAIPALASPFALAAWYLAVHYGNWAGEWAIGGFEAKTLAYPFALLGVALAMQARWRPAWILLAVAVAWHPIVGGWVGLSVGIVWLLMPDVSFRFREQWTSLAAGCAIGCVGVLPAAFGLQGQNVVGKVVATAVHVFLRLPHHMSPQLFAPERHIAALTMLGMFLLVAILYFSLRRSAASSQSTQQDGCNPWRAETILLGIAFTSLAFAGIGLLVDTLVASAYPATASKILRFYWFRWADVAVPLAAIGVAATLLANRSQVSKTSPEPLSGPRKLVLATIGGLIIVLSAAHLVRTSSSVPVADQLLVDSGGAIEFDSDRYVDWLAACEWIRENTPADSLWLTPKYQQTFKWHAHRAEVVCWKDVPQDNNSVHEWFRRIEACEPPRDSNGRIRAWQSDEILALADQYDFEYILVDRSYQKFPLLQLEIVYPTIQDSRYINNKNFAIFRVRK